MKKSVSIQVYGRVQGVAFRYSTRAKALSLGIKGFVKNMRDGSVYIEALGDEEDMQAFVEWCNQGPPAARVVNIQVEDIDVVDADTFLIK